MKLGKYQHFKGKIYEVIAVAQHSETKEELVIYKDEEGNVWARPINMFLEKVDKPEYNYAGPRFRFIE